MSQLGFLILAGGGWTILGYSMLPKTVLYLGGGQWSLLLWPAGLWFAFLGLSEWMKTPILRWLLGEPSWNTLAVGLLWLGTYIVYCGNFVR